MNANGVFFANRAAIRAMEPNGYGRIVNVASIAGKEGNPMAAAYSASKAAVITMTKSIGKDVAGSQILVNSVAPAVIDTAMLADMSEEHLDYMVSRPWPYRQARGGGEPHLLLASEELTFATGAVFDLSGGRLSTDQRAGRRLMRESWLITGSHGCIGAWAARILVREEATVTAFDIAADRHRLELVMEPDELERISSSVET